MNRNILKHILILLLSSTAVLSCSADYMPAEDVFMQDGKTFTLVISGSASDHGTSIPIEEIRISLKATETLGKGKTKIHEKSAYTDNKGMFSIKAEGFGNPISITLTADDPNEIYMSATYEIPMVSWDSQYNMTGNTFYINDCSFHLEKDK